MRDSRNKIFIPMSIDQNSTTREGYFASPLKMAVAIVGIIPGIPWSLYALKVSNDSVQVLIIAILVYAFLYSYLIRYFVFEERRLKRMMKTLDRNKVSRADYFWGIDEIDPKGVIKYKYSTGLRRAVVVKVTRGSAVGVPDSFEDNFKELNLKFTRNLLSQGFSFMKYTKMETKQLPEGLSDCFRRMEKIKDKGQKSIMKLNLETISGFTKDYKSVVVDYYVVSNSNLRLLSSFRSLVEDAVRTTYGNDTYFRGTSLLNEGEVVEFIEDVSYIKGVTSEGYYEVEDRKFEEYGKVFRVFDESDTEVYLDLDEAINEPLVVANRGRGKTLDEIEQEYLKSVEVSDTVENDDSEGYDFGEKEDVAVRIDFTKYSDAISDDDDLFALAENVSDVRTNASLSDDTDLFSLAPDEEEEEYLTLYEDEDGNLRDEDGNIVDEEGNIITDRSGE